MRKDDVDMYSSSTKPDHGNDVGNRRCRSRGPDLVHERLSEQLMQECNDSLEWGAEYWTKRADAVSLH